MLFSQRFHASRRLWWLGVGLVITLMGTSFLLADDDDDDDDDHRPLRGNTSNERGGEAGRAAGEGSSLNRSAREGSTHAFPAVANAQWKEECGSCHIPYHPGLLPERSWKAMMTGLDKHFGENAELDPATRDALTTFLVANAADKSTYRRSVQLTRSIPATATPLRVTETRWYLSKHDEIKAEVYKRPKVGSKASCGACHAKADVGIFDEDTVKIPK